MHLTAETRLNAILDGTGAGTWEYNLDTGEIIFNERWATMLGYTLEELSPLSFQTWEKLSHPTDIESANQALTAWCACFTKTVTGVTSTPAEPCSTMTRRQKAVG